MLEVKTLEGDILEVNKSEVDNLEVDNLKYIVAQSRTECWQSCRLDSVPAHLTES
jgi:hypothetical protein